MEEKELVTDSLLVDAVKQNPPGLQSNKHRSDPALLTLRDLQLATGGDILSESSTCESLTDYAKDTAANCTPKTIGKVILRKIPIIEALRGYNLKKYLLADVIAGLTVGVMHIPQGMGFALLAGLPPVYGLYTSFFPVLAYFFFTPSKSTSFGTQSLVCLMLGPLLESECQQVGLCTPAKTTHSNVEVLSPSATDNSTLLGYNTNNTENVLGSILNGNYTNYGIVGNNNSLVDNITTSQMDPGMLYKIELAVIMSLLIGLIQVILSVFQLGVVSTYFSETFISACNAGAAFQILTTQVRFMIGVTIPPISGRFKLIKTWVQIFTNITTINVADTIVSVICLLALIIVKKFVNENPKVKKVLKFPIPIEILVVILSTVISKFAQLESKFDVNVVGVIPQGLPAIGPPNMKHMKIQYVANAFPISLIGFLSAVLMTKLFANKYEYQVDINQELFANGITNAISSFFVCFPSSVAPPRTMLFDSIGGKSQVAFLFSSLLVFLVLMVIGHLFQTLPTAVLACIIVVALIPLLERLVDGILLWKINKLDFLVWIGTLLSVIILDLGIGIVIGVLLSILSVVLHTQKPKSYKITPLKNSQGFLPSDECFRLDDGCVKVLNNVTIYRFECPLYYANAEVFAKQVMGIAHKMKAATVSFNCNGKPNEISMDIKGTETPSSLPNVLIIDFSVVHYLDIVGLKVLKGVHLKTSAMDVKLKLANCSIEILKEMDRFQLIDAIGSENIFLSLRDAIKDN